MARSFLTASLLSSSVNARLMPSLTSHSFCSSAFISPMISSSRTGSKILEAMRDPGLVAPDDRRWLREGDVCLLERGLRVAERVGERDGDVMTVDEAHEYAGHKSYMCCVSSSCCP